VRIGGPLHIARWSHCGPLAPCDDPPAARIGDGAGRFVVGRYEIIDAQQTPAAPT
jgi:hypothetical protein